MKYIDANRLKAEIKKKRNEIVEEALDPDASIERVASAKYKKDALSDAISIIDSLQQEKQMPDSIHLIAEWEKEKAVLEQKDFRGDAERMAYNAFLDGFVKGLVYEGTK